MRCIHAVEEVVDVTKRYTVDYSTVVTRRRRSIREPVLAKVRKRCKEKKVTLQDEALVLFSILDGIAFLGPFMEHSI